jgi:hypothetical protein
VATSALRWQQLLSKAYLCGELLKLALRLHCLALCMHRLLHAAAQRSTLPPVLVLQLSNTPLGSISWWDSNSSRVCTHGLSAGV